MERKEEEEGGINQTNFCSALPRNVSELLSWTAGLPHAIFWGKNAYIYVFHKILPAKQKLESTS